MASAELVGRLRTERDLAGPGGMRPRTTRERRRALLRAASRRRSCARPSASTWPKWMIPTSSTPSTALQLAGLLLGEVRREGPVPPAARRVLDERVEAGPEGDAPRRPPRRRRRRRRAPTAPAPTVRPSPGRGPSRRPSWLDGREASRWRAGTRRAAAAAPSVRPCRSDVARRGAERGARTEQEHEQQRAEAQHEHVDIDPGFGSAFLAWPIGIEQRSRRSRARRPARHRPR